MVAAPQNDPPRRDHPDQRIACYPGSFDPLTIAHLAVAEAAVAAGLDRVDLVLSVDALGKGHLDRASVERRRDHLDQVAATRPWLAVRITTLRLIADIAAGYDAVVMGADKWRQVLDPAWYAGPAARDAAIARLPRVLVAPRGDDEPEGVELLRVDATHRHISSSGLRQGWAGSAAWAVEPGDPDDPRPGG